MRRYLRVRTTLRVRLAALYTGLVVLALVAFGVGAYFLLDAQLRASFDRELVSDVHHASDALASDVGADGTLRPDARFLEHLGHTGGIVEVLSVQGDLLATSDASQLLPLTPEDVLAGSQHVHQVRGIAVAGAMLRVVVEPIDAPDGSIAGLVAWAKPTDEIDSFLRSVVLALAVAGTTVCLLTFGAGWLLARRALSPVSDLRGTARSVAASGDVVARVPVQSTDELGELAVAFNEMLATIETNEVGLEQFLADASHELRTPLTTVRANLELALRTDIRAADRKELTAEAKREADRMARLVTELLSLTRAELETERRRTLVQLDTVVEQSIREICRHPGPAVETARLDPAVVTGDPDRLKELCHILLDNARHYAPDGTVRVTLVDGATPSLAVADNGIGISAGDREHVFDRFYRGDAARRLQPQGSGLGLAIAQRIAAMHNASLSIAETPGGGTIVEVTFRPAGGIAS